MDEDTSWIILWWAIIGGVIGGFIGSTRNNVGKGVILGALFGPIGWIIVLCLDNRQKCPECGAPMSEGALRCSRCRNEFDKEYEEDDEDEDSEPELEKCPFCAEFIKAEAIKCRYCGSALTAPSRKAVAPDSVEQYIPCPHCGRNIAVSFIKQGENYCPSCSQKFIAE